MKDVSDCWKPLLELPQEQLSAVNDLIFKQSKITLAAKVLKDDFGIYKTTNHETLRTYLQRYKKHFKGVWQDFNMGKLVHVDAIPEDLKATVPKDAGDVALLNYIPLAKVRVVMKEAIQQFDALKELERLALFQYDRAIKVMEYESKLPDFIEEKDKAGNIIQKPILSLDKTGRYELESAANMMANIIKLQMDLGIRHREEKAELHQHIHLGEKEAELMRAFENMKNVAQTTTRAIELMVNHPVPADQVPDPDGLELSFDGDDGYDDPIQHSSSQHSSIQHNPRQSVNPEGYTQDPEGDDA